MDGVAGSSAASTMACLVTTYCILQVVDQGIQA